MIYEYEEWYPHVTMMSGGWMENALFANDDQWKPTSWRPECWVRTGWGFVTKNVVRPDSCSYPHGDESRMLCVLGAVTCGRCEGTSNLCIWKFETSKADARWTGFCGLKHTLYIWFSGRNNSPENWLMNVLRRTVMGSPVQGGFCVFHRRWTRVHLRHSRNAFLFQRRDDKFGVFLKNFLVFLNIFRASAHDYPTVANTDAA